MRTRSLTPVALIALFLTQPALAQTAGAADADPQRIETPPLGVRQEIRHGLWADLELGTFFTLGATDTSVSNAQPLLGLALGYDLTDNVVLGLGVSHGASQGACYGQLAGGACTGASAFSVVMLDLFAGYLHPVTYDWFVGAKVVGGLALLTPVPVEVEGQDERLGTGFDGGLVLTTELHTHLNHFVVGLDLGFRYVSGPGGVSFPAMAIYPRVKYVF